MNIYIQKNKMECLSVSGGTIIIDVSSFQTLVDDGVTIIKAKYLDEDGEQKYCILKKYKSRTKKILSEMSVFKKMSLCGPSKYVVNAIGFDDNYIIMEYCKYGDFFTHLIDNDSNVDMLNIKKIIYQCINGIKYIHDCGYIYVDIKLENIGIYDDDYHIKLLDLGGAREFDKKYDRIFEYREMNYERTIIYSPPEIVNKCAIHAEHLVLIDAWGVGVLLFMLIFKKMPFGVEICNIKKCFKSEAYFTMKTQKTYDMINTIQEDDVRILLNSLLVYDYHDRLNIFELDINKKNILSDFYHSIKYYILNEKS